MERALTRATRNRWVRRQRARVRSGVGGRARRGRLVRLDGRPVAGANFSTTSGTAFDLGARFVSQLRLALALGKRRSLAAHLLPVPWVDALRADRVRPTGRAAWKCGPWIVQPGYRSEIAFASRIASAAVRSSSCEIGLPAAGGANEIVERPVLSSTDMKIRSGRAFMDVPTWRCAASRELLRPLHSDDST